MITTIVSAIEGPISAVVSGCLGESKSQVLKHCLMKVQKEIMNLIYVCFSNRQFFFPQDLKFFSIIFLTIFNLISQKYVDQYLRKLKRHYGFKTQGRSIIPLIKQKRLPNSYFFFLFLFYFCRLYFSAFTIFNAICKTCKVIDSTLPSVHASSPMSLFPTYQEQEDEGSE